MKQDLTSASKEREVLGSNGWLHLLIAIALLVAGVALLMRGMWPGFLVIFTAITWFCGLITVAPNEANVLTFFGPYIGTLRESGFYWVNPFYGKSKISLRARNLEGAKLKVNDKRGNPIEIAVVVVWKVENTAAAKFDVEDFEEFVRIQSESAVRHLASVFAYDHGVDSDEKELTLRESTENVTEALLLELQDRCSKAGIRVVEARIAHLAYAPEIAGVMLRRQQAEAVIAARQKIVHGAVSMVRMALHELEEDSTIQFSPERRAEMVNNLLVVLCGESQAHPVIQVGSAKSGE